MTDEERAVEAFRSARESLDAREKSATITPVSGNPFEGLAAHTSDPRPPETTRKPYTGQLLPVSVNERDEMRFDPYAGLLGGFTRPIKFAGDVAAGRIPADVRNPAYLGGAVDMALNYGPAPVASRVGPGIVKAPSQDDIFAAGSKAFNDFRGSQQLFPGSEYRQFLRQSADDLDTAGRFNIPEGAPQAHTALAREGQRVANYPFVMADDISRLKTQLDASGQKGANLAGTMQAREGLYKYLESKGDDNMRKGVDNWRQASHSEQITGKDTAKSLKNIAKGEGDTLSAKQRRDSIADTLIAIDQQKKSGRGFTAAEEAALNKGLLASPSINLAQTVGNKLGNVAGGAAGGVGFAGAVGALASGHPGVAASVLAAGAVPAAAGKALRSYANRGARLASEEADNFIRSQSPLAREAFATAPPLHTGFGAPGAMGGSRGGGGLSGPMLSNVIQDYLQQKATPQPIVRVLPDGTIEELS